MRLIATEQEARDLIAGKKFCRGFGASVDVRIKTQVCDAETGAVIKDNPFRKNLTYDIGLNAMARSSVGTPTSLRCGPASMARVCRIGDSTSPTKIQSGSITFTQAGTTLTASSGFFTAAMVGAIFKWGASGSGGAEIYISAFTSSTVVTVGTSATVSTPDFGVVWMVQQSAMGNLLFTSSSYQTNSGDNVTNIVGNVVSHQRTFTFPVQGAPYNVNEVGYTSQSAGTQVLGRIVLPSTDVVGTSNFYRVIIIVTVTYTPSAPAAVSNIGVNWNTAGNAMIESASIMPVFTDGNLTSSPTAFASMDASSEYAGYLGNTSGGCYLIARIGATYSQQGSINSGLPLSWGTLNANPGYLQVDSNLRQWTYVPGSVGQMKLSYTGNSSTTGQTCYGIGISPNYNTQNTNRDKPFFDILFTTPQALPNGSWLPSIEFTLTYGRTLVN